ncbi:MAG: hypothetical protein QOI20_1038 [Acidimicrobiaceae bacterium]|jgi:hypothetical protein|nr:hypothetical protein [Acidimicrobiaceae bacterium]
MRITRIRLRNYRGIEAHEVRLPATGVTVVEGDNEVGKTSLAEALDLLFDYLDTSTNKAVKAVKPVHKDAGSEIEVDIEAGPYRFTYSKRFHRDRSTTLVVHAPRPENHTGREAHERALAILHEAVDLPLWRALRLQQGVRPDQADLSEQTSLAAALDTASAGTLAGDREATLIDLARAELDRFHTPGRKLKAEIADLQRAEQDAANRVEELRRRLAELEDDVEYAADLARHMGGLAEELEAQGRRVEEYRRKWASVDALLRDVTEAKLAADLAAADHRAACDEQSRRQALVEALDRAQGRHRELGRERDRHRPGLQSAVSAVQAAEQRLAEASERGEAAKAGLAAAQADFTFARDSLDLAQMTERLDRVRKAEAALEALDTLLEDNRVGPEVLEAIEDAHLAVVQGRVRLEGESPLVEVEALRPLEIRVGDGFEALPAGGSTTVAMGPSSAMELGGVARIAVRGRGEAGQLVASLATSERRLADLCTAAGVADVGEAKTAAAARREAAFEREGLTTRMAADLRDLTPDRLAGKVERLRARLAEDPRPPLDFDTARGLVEEAEAGAGVALELLREAHHEVELRRRDEQQARARFDAAEREVELAHRQVESARHDLESARARVPDGVLAGRVDATAKAVAKADVALAHADAAADKAGPEELKGALENATAVFDKLEAERRGTAEEQVRVRERLSLWGQEGLHDRLGEAEADLEHRSRQRRAAERRAAAARRLYETLERCRGQARRAYMAPLKAKVEAFGRVVFGDDFTVELGEDLRIASRTLRGVTVEFDQLSTGAREQLCVISRLACAAIVAPDGGVPVILDDALGWSDSKRLEKLGAVLSMAAQDAQVVVLTCLPERYRHVGAAHVVKLAR